MAKRKFFEFKNVSEESVDIYLYDEIGDSFWNDSTSAKDFLEELATVSDMATLNIHINSPGGSVFDGIAISTALRLHKGETHAYVDALAASIASVIACSCNYVHIADRAAIMIHKASCIAAGNANDFIKLASDLEQIDNQIANTYLDFSDKDDAEAWLERMTGESWYFGQDAVDIGLADDVFASAAMAACLTPEVVAKYGYKHVPEAIVASESDTHPIINNVEETPEEDAGAEAPAEEVIEQDDDAPKARLISFSNQNIIIHEGVKTNED